MRGLRAVIRLGLARRPGRVDDHGVALTLDEMDRSRWDQRLLRAGLADATYAARGDGRFALESAISGLHSVAPTFADTDWSRIADLYVALERQWPSPAVHVALLVARAQVSPEPDALTAIEQETSRVWPSTAPRSRDATPPSPWPTCAGGPGAAPRPQCSTPSSSSP